MRKRKAASLGSRRHAALVVVVVGAGLIAIAASFTSFSEETAKNFSKKIPTAAEAGTNLLGNSSTRVFN